MKQIWMAKYNLLVNVDDGYMKFMSSLYYLLSSVYLKTSLIFLKVSCKSKKSIFAIQFA